MGIVFIWKPLWSTSSWNDINYSCSKFIITAIQS